MGEHSEMVRAEAVALLDAAYVDLRRVWLPTSVPLGLYLGMDAMGWAWWDAGCYAVNHLGATVNVGVR